MKNQYVGDIGDYGKYALLRSFIKANVRVGVNWYLTESDTSTDGKITGYLKKGEMRQFYPPLFDTLTGIAFHLDKSVADIRNSGILGDTVFFDEEMLFTGKPLERESQRKVWFDRSKDALSLPELIFMDPDNGLLVSGKTTRRGAEKYVLPEEVESYFRMGKNVVYYCHKGRRKEEAWKDYKDFMFNRIPEAKSIILTYHKGTQRSYVFLVHEADYARYRMIIDEFRVKWREIFTE